MGECFIRACGSGGILGLSDFGGKRGSVGTVVSIESTQ